MEPAYKLSRYAQDDLAGIFAYTLDTWGTRQFRRYHRLLVEAFDGLSKEPFSIRSKPRQELFKDCRSVYAGRHVILYRVKNGVVEIARILHQSMDLERHIPPEYYQEEPEV